MILTPHTTYTVGQLEALWIQAGGDPAQAPRAAAQAMAESGGNENAVSPTNDVGLWQINRTSWGPLATTNPLGNAQAAVKISQNGTNWRPWCTAWSDSACGTQGGAYDGPGAPYLRYLSTAIAAGGQSATGTTLISSVTSGSSAAPKCVVSIPFGGCLIDETQIGRVKGVMLMSAGTVLLLAGLFIIVGGSGSGGSVAKDAAVGAIGGSIAGPEGTAAGAVAGAGKGAKKAKDDSQGRRYDRESKAADREVKASMRADRRQTAQENRMARKYGKTYDQNGSLVA